MAQETIYAYGIQEITIPVGEYAEIAALEGKAKIYLGVSDPNMPTTYSYSQTLEKSQVTLGTYSTDKMVKIVNGAGPVLYDIGAAPVITLPTTETPTVYQGTATAKTVDATLTAAEIKAGIITVNQAAAGTSTLTLPLATAMDTAFANFTAGDSFDFSLINTSTVAAEDALLATNTGWTIVGNLDVASNAAATDKSAGRFRATKTGTGAWTLYRLS